MENKEHEMCCLETRDSQTCPSALKASSWAFYLVPISSLAPTSSILDMLDGKCAYVVPLACTGPSHCFNQELHTYLLPERESVQTSSNIPHLTYTHIFPGLVSGIPITLFFYHGLLLECINNSSFKDPNKTNFKVCLKKVPSSLVDSKLFPYLYHNMLYNTWHIVGA
jgi:hypothetical protein